MNHCPLVSIIVNNYNYGHFLREAIDSALNQTYFNTEVIVVDDGSTDNSREIIATYGDKIVPVLKENEGQASAFNAGFSVSRGQIILFLDSDDMLHHSTSEVVVPYSLNPDVVKVHWPLWVINESGKKTGEVYPDFNLCEGDIREQIILNGPESSGHAPTSGNAWSRNFLEKVLPIPEWGDKHGADAYLMTLAPIYGLIKKIAEPRGFFRLHSENSFRRSKEFMIEFHLGRYPKRCQVLTEHLKSFGITVDQEKWNLQYLRIKNLRDLPIQIERSIPKDERFILVDEDFFSNTHFANNLSIPFIERNGEYWGLPEDDETAIKELERLRKSGANYIVFVWACFWWLEYYSAFNDYLHSNFRCDLENDYFVVFNLKHNSIP